MENETFISDPEWNSLISEMYGEQYSIVAESGMRYFESTSTITATGAASYTEPADQLAYIGLDRIVNSTTGERQTLTEVMTQERSQWSGLTGDAVVYSFVDDQIYLYPKPSSGTYQLLYIPQSPDLSVASDSTSVDVVTPDGEAFLIWGVAAKALPKGEMDPSSAVREREASRQRFTEWVTLRALVNPRRRIIDPGRSNLGELEYLDPGGWWRR